MENFGFLVRRLFWLFVVVLTLITVLFITLLTYRPTKETFKNEILVDKSFKEWQPKNVVFALQDGSMPPKVKAGYLLVAETPGQMGPMAKDPKMRYAGNNLTCTNCH